MVEVMVIFTSNNARIVKNPINFEFLKTLPNVVVNPDLSAVKGIPPHFWKLENGNIRPMTFDEQTIRLKNIARYGADNKIRRVAKWKRQSKFDWLNVILMALVIVLGVKCFLKIQLYQ